MKKKSAISVILIVVLIFATTFNSYAGWKDTVETKKNEKATANRKLEEAKANINKLAKDKTTVKQEVDNLGYEIEQLRDEINSLNQEIDKLNKSIEEKKKEIEEKEKNILEKRELLKKRLVGLYKNGSTTYLDVLLGSSNYIEMVASFDVVKEIARADTELINTISEEKKAIEKDKKELEDSKTEVETKKASVETKNNSLKAKQQEKEKYFNQLNAEQQQQIKNAEEFKKQIAAAENEIARIVAANASKPAKKPSGSAGQINNSSGVLGWPLANKRARITSTFGPRSAPVPGASTNHGAIDIGVAYQPVYAAEAGKVVAAQRFSGYGNFIMIYHPKLNMYTCYAHLSKYNVSAGDSVKRGQQIAVSGNTGYSTGPHLHFEVRVGGSSKSCRRDPLDYVKR